MEDDFLRNEFRYCFPRLLPTDYHPIGQYDITCYSSEPSICDSSTTDKKHKYEIGLISLIQQFHLIAQVQVQRKDIKMKITKNKIKSQKQNPPNWR